MAIPIQNNLLLRLIFPNCQGKSEGDIFYFTAGQLPYEFEDACYKTEKGKVYPEVVKTKFGYHIITDMAITWLILINSCRNINAKTSPNTADKDNKDDALITPILFMLCRYR